jgi:RNA polymerase sigma-70 factor, ECF subfamily
MESRKPGHSLTWMDPTISLAPLESGASLHPVSATAPLTAQALYEEHFEFVWRSLRRLGVSPSRMDDAVQDVFLVVHRKVGDFEQRSSVKTWLFGIVLRVAHDYHRSHKRKEKAVHDEPRPDPDSLVDESMPGPLELAEQADAIRLLDELLSHVTSEKREVFLLAELEQMTAPEISEALGIQLTTVYSRLRAARIEFEQALSRRRAQEGGGRHGSE